MTKSLKNGKYYKTTQEHFLSAQILTDRSTLLAKEFKVNFKIFFTLRYSRKNTCNVKFLVLSIIKSAATIGLLDTDYD